MYGGLYFCFDQNYNLCDKQFEFRGSYSTDHPMIKLVDNIDDSFNQDKYTQGIFIDLPKALHTVNHEILVKRL